MSTQPLPQAQPLPLFYRKVVPLSRERHGHWYIDHDQGYVFARDTNCVYLAAIEFPQAAREYPIVFTRGTGDAVLPVALLGVRDAQNLFVDEAGRWLGSYVPAYVRRYPFILAADSGASNFTVCIDEAFSGFNTVREGEPLIDDKGSHGPLLERSIAFLKDYQRHSQLTDEFCRLLVDLSLLEPVQANVQMKDGERFALAGFFCVSKDRLKALPGERLQDLVGRNFMDLVYAHLLSLANMGELINRLGPVK